MRTWQFIILCTAILSFVKIATIFYFDFWNRCDTKHITVYFDFLKERNKPLIYYVQICRITTILKWRTAELTCMANLPSSGELIPVHDVETKRLPIPIYWSPSWLPSNYLSLFFLYCSVTNFLSSHLMSSKRKETGSLSLFFLYCSVTNFLSSHSMASKRKETGSEIHEKVTLK